MLPAIVARDERQRTLQLRQRPEPPRRIANRNPADVRAAAAYCRPHDAHPLQRQHEHALPAKRPHSRERSIPLSGADVLEETLSERDLTEPFGAGCWIVSDCRLSQPGGIDEIVVCIFRPCRRRRQGIVGGERRGPERA